MTAHITNPFLFYFYFIFISFLFYPYNANGIFKTDSLNIGINDKPWFHWRFLYFKECLILFPVLLIIATLLVFPFYNSFYTSR